MTTTFARKTVLRILSNLSQGSLTVVCPDRTYAFGNAAHELNATVIVHNERFFSRVLWGGSDEAGDAYMDGDWSSPDPVAVVRVAMQPGWN